MINVQNITILGATGTIGLHTLDVIARHPERFRVYALTAHSKVDVLLEQCQKFNPVFAVMLDADAAEELHRKLQAIGSETEVLCGVAALEKVAAHPDVNVVMAAIVGSAGLKPAMAAALAGKRILLANKETLVMSGSLFMEAVKQGGATLLPIDSEHNAIFQVMPSQRYANLTDGGVKRIWRAFRMAGEAELEACNPSASIKSSELGDGPKNYD